MPETPAIVVFTAKSIERLLREGGTSSWRLDRNNARQCTFAVCTRNANADWVEGAEAHHAAFLVGRVKDVITPIEDQALREGNKLRPKDGRFLVQFSEFARVDIPDVWKGDRNPVKYSTMETLGIDPSTLNWETMPDLPEPVLAPNSSQSDSTPLTIAEAKRGLAMTFGVNPDAIEIVIRG
jgi:hypothetical protein